MKIFPFSNKRMHNFSRRHAAVKYLVEGSLWIISLSSRLYGLHWHSNQSTGKLICWTIRTAEQEYWTVRGQKVSERLHKAASFIEPYYNHRQLNVQKSILRSSHTVYLFVLCGYENKQRLFLYTILTDWFNSRDLTFYSPVVTICAASLTFKNSTFCPHSVFMCFVWISEQTAINSLYRINWLVS